MSKELSMHLVLWNGAKYLPYLMQSIMDQTYQNFSLLVVDNGSTDESAQWMQTYYPNIHVVRHKENAGFAKAHNEAIQWTKSTFVMVLNQDVVLAPDYLERVLVFLRAHTDAGAAQGKLFQWDFAKTETPHDDEANQTSPIHSPGKTNHIDTLGLKLHADHHVTELGRGARDEETSHNEPIQVFGLSATAAVYRRTALEDCSVPLPSRFPNETGMRSRETYEIFDEQFFAYKEDVDLSYRMNLRDWTSWLVPHAHAYHDRSVGRDQNVSLWTRKQLRKSRPYFVRYHSAKNHLLFLLKNVPARIAFTHGWRILAYELGKLLFLLFFEPTTLAAYGKVVTCVPHALQKRKYIQSRRSPRAVENIKRWLRGV